MTISQPFSRPISLLMVGTSSTISLQGGSAMGNWQQTLQVVRLNHLYTTREFVTLSNLSTDHDFNLIPFTADTLGFKTYPPAYLSPKASGKNLLIGANFASAGSGYDDKTAILSVRRFEENKISNYQTLSQYTFKTQDLHLISYF